MKKRHQFLGTSWESLEGRQLLNGAYGSPRAGLAYRPAQVQMVNANALNQANLRVVPGQAGANRGAFNQVRFNQALNTQQRFQATRRALDSVATPTTDGTSGAIDSANPYSSSTIGYAPFTRNSGGYASLRPGAYQMQTSNGRVVLQSASVVSPMPANQAPGVRVGGGAAVAPALGNPPRRAMAPGLMAAGMKAADFVGGDTMPAADPPLFLGMLDGATLSKDDVAALKSAVDGFASSYTFGVDTKKDEAATDALRSAFDDLSLTVWSQSHVVSAANVSMLAGAVDGFAKSYTSGTDAAKDKAAWVALRTSIDQLVKDMAPADPADGQPVSPFTYGPDVMTVMRGDGPVFGPGGILVDNLVYGPKLTKADVGDLQKSVADFAVAYTSGADPKADQAATEALQKGLGNLVSDRWQRDMPDFNGVGRPRAEPLMTLESTARDSVPAATGTGIASAVAPKVVQAAPVPVTTGIGTGATTVTS